MPPRPYTNMLVKGFFDHVNYHFEVIYQPSFMSSYLEWWDQRRDWQSGQPLSISTITFTALVLQICANSAQFLSPSALKQLEEDLGESAEQLGSRCYHSALSLGSFIPPGEGGLVHVQQLFLGAIWLKTEAEGKFIPIKTHD